MLSAVGYTANAGILGAKPPAKLAALKETKGLSVTSAFMPTTSYRAYRFLKARNSAYWPNQVLPGVATPGWETLIVANVSDKLPPLFVKDSMASTLTKASFPYLEPP